MAILNNCELWFAKLDEKRPNNKFNRQNPTWELQIRTTDKTQKKSWEELELPVKAVVPDDDGLPFFRVNLRKKSIKEDGEKASPVAVIGGNLVPIDPNTIGNGSIGNVRIYQYNFPRQDGTKGTASVLMGVQLTKHIVYHPKPRTDDFGEADMETIDAPVEDFEAEGEEEVVEKAPKTPKTPKVVTVAAEDEDEY